MERRRPTTCGVMARSSRPRRQAGLSGLLALWSRQFALLTGLVAEQRRRERCG